MQRFLKYKGKFSVTSNANLKIRITKLARSLALGWLDTNRIYAVSSVNSRSSAVARICGLSKIWQETLGTGPAYIIETVSEKFDKLSDGQKDEVVLHEITHIPHNFSGALLPHTRRGKSNFHKKLDRLIASYRKNKR